MKKDTLLMSMLDQRSPVVNDCSWLLQNHIEG